MSYSSTGAHPPARKWIKRWTLPSILLGIASTLALYFMLWLLPILPFRAFFVERGVIQPLIIAVALTIASYCFVRILQIKREVKAARKRWLLDTDEFSSGLSTSLRESIRLLSNSNSIYANRQERILTLFLHSSSRQIAREIAIDDSDATGSDIENAYMVTRTMIWSMPMLGFLGTVLGISVSISGFSGLLAGVADINAVKTGLTQVTAGLSTAFDTTLLGIIGAIFCTLLSSVSEKSEYQLSQVIQEQINDQLLPRLSQKNG